MRRTVGLLCLLVLVSMMPLADALTQDRSGARRSARRNPRRRLRRPSRCRHRCGRRRDRRKPPQPAPLAKPLLLAPWSLLGAFVPRISVPYTADM